MAKSVPAIFLDRDGTINVDHGYVHEIDNFEFIDGVIDAMRELKKMVGLLKGRFLSPLPIRCVLFLPS